MKIIEAPIFFYFPVKAPSGNSYAKAIAKKIVEDFSKDGEYVYPFGDKVDPMAIMLDGKLDDKSKSVWARMRLIDESLIDVWNPVDSCFTVELIVKPPVGEPTKVVGLERLSSLGQLRWWRTEDA